MRLGISTACLYPMLLEKSLSTLVSMNFKLFEVFINTVSELKSGYLKDLRKTADENGCKIKSVHPFTSGYESFLIFSDYERRFFDSLEFYKHYFEACNILGADILVLHGKKKNKKDVISEEEYFERYLKMFELGKTFGVTVAQENVNMFWSNSPVFIEHMKSFCRENCAFVFDIKQAVREKEDPFKICSAMGTNIVHLHLNDNDANSDCLLPGAGSMDYRRLMKMLSSFGYSGDAIIEVYRNSFGKLSELYRAQQNAAEIVEFFNNNL